ncbi:hypothetical protein VTK56DRAFT_6292 [Thermocarpiscus australiensis]
MEATSSVTTCYVWCCGVEGKGRHRPKHRPLQQVVYVAAWGEGKRKERRKKKPEKAGKEGLIRRYLQVLETCGTLLLVS